MKGRQKTLLERPPSLEFERLPLLRSRDERTAVLRRQMIWLSCALCFVFGVMIGRLF